MMSGDVNKALDTLIEAGIDKEDARFDIGVLYSYYADEADFKAAVRRRAEGVPVSYITGIAAFYREEYKVKPCVLIPRADTELLVESALKFLGALDFPAGDVAQVPQPSLKKEKLDIIDLCTGSGCVGISLSNSLARKEIPADMILSDVSDEALDMAKRNIEYAGSGSNKDRISILNFDLLGEKLPDRLLDSKFDLITANPPYINDSDFNILDPSVKDYEPRLALMGGADGLKFYAPVLKFAHEHLNKGGAVMVEHGFDQGEAVASLMTEKGFIGVKTLKDFGGNDRVTIGIRESL